MGVKKKKELGEKEREEERSTNKPNHNCFKISPVEYLFIDYLENEVFEKQSQRTSELGGYLVPSSVFKHKMKTLNGVADYPHLKDLHCLASCQVVQNLCLYLQRVSKVSRYWQLTKVYFKSNWYLY